MNSIFKRILSYLPSLGRGLGVGLLLLALPISAQSPKSLKQVKKAVYTLQTYDAEGNVLSTGNGFFANEAGDFITSYALLPNCAKAVVVDSKGKTHDVVKVLGANETYDIVRLQTVPIKKLASTPIDTTSTMEHTSLFLPAIGKEKKVYDTWIPVLSTEQAAGNYNYYTLHHAGSPTLSHRPLLDATGNVVAIVQPSVETDTVLYALDIRYALDLAVKALSVNDRSYRALPLRKALPRDIDQALVSLFLVSDQDDAALRSEVIDEFILSFPDSHEGYLSRASHHIALKSDSAYALAEADHAMALEHAADKADEVHFQIAKQMLSVALDTLQQYKDWNCERVLAEIDKARAINPLPIYTQQQGDIYITLKDYTSAYEKYMEVNRSDIGSPDTWLRTAYIIEQRAGEGDVELAIALLDSAVNKATINSQPSTLNQASPYVLERALLKARHGLHRPAVADYNLYEELVGTINTDRFYYLREQSEAAGRMFQQALDDIDRAIALAPRQPVYLLEKASLNVRVARYAEALPILEVLINAFPNDVDCNRLLGFCHIQLGNNSIGCSYLEKAAAMGDTSAKNLLDRYK
ncbi:MAG: tetratricopeptide repeat protein [Bacteroidaceae bacterium]|nr:tetratricopeptide repeat protein [Bacteroidaceae bacterium]